MKTNLSYQVLETIFNNPEISIAKLAYILKQPYPTIQTIVAKLKKENYIINILQKFRTAFVLTELGEKEIENHN